MHNISRDIRKHWLLPALLWLVICPVVMGQSHNGSSTPFSMSTYGELNDNVPNTYRGMGGVGFGMRSNKAINPMQPAAYTAGDSLTFMFDVAASASWTGYGDKFGSTNKANGNLEYIAMQFPLWKRYVAFSAGILPFSAKGYELTKRDSINSDYHYQTLYAGYGTISQVYVGLGINIYDWLALGANLYYMFGEVEDYRGIVFDENLTSVAQGSFMDINSLRFRVGGQFFHTFGDHSFVLGTVFENKMKVRGKELVIESAYADTVSTSECGELPMMFGVGANYCWANRLTVAFDFGRHCFAQTEYAEAWSLKNRDRYAFGLEYRNNPMGRRYIDRIAWRAGMSLTDSYQTTMDAKQIGASLGVGFPLRNAGTVFNVSLEYAHRNLKNGGLRDDQIKLTLNAAIVENWFFKRKL